ncbi:EAL domain-containing protein [Pseudomonas luteola]|nr:EAL domain-containing protein [Pseudomonas luteola]
MMLLATSLPDGFVPVGSDHHHFVLVLLSYLVATAAGYTALYMARRASSAALSKNRLLWCGVGGLALGSGIWSMHFIAMLSYASPVSMQYGYSMTLLSLGIAVAVSCVVMWLISRERLATWEYLAASVAAGCGIAAMHYTGMSAINSVGVQVYNPLLFLVSILVAILASLAALIMAFYVRNQAGRHTQLLMILGSLILGGAIVSMHFTGMAALTLVVPEDTPVMMMAHDAHHGLLGTIIAFLTLVVICAGLTATRLEHRFHEQSVRLEEMSTALSQVTLLDPLTQLLNDYSFTQTLARIINKATPEEGLALLNLDLDHFKRINDSLGYNVGDDLLTQVAQRITAVLDSTVHVARQGNEFLVLVPEAQPEHSEHLAMRLLEQLRPPFNLSGQQIGMTLSIGIAHYPKDGRSANELLRNAGLALGQCKRNGRNRFLHFAPELQTQAEETLHLEQELRQAITEGTLEVHYQPIVTSDARTTASLEALVRWNHPTLGPIRPDRFVHVAELSGQIGELDHWVMRRACRDLKTLRDLGYGELRVAVNCSPLNLTDRTLPKRVEEALSEAELPPEALTLELTENALMHNLNLAIELLERIRELGVKVSIDDFGSGYSSLAYLSKLKVDTLKVDRSFVRDIPNQQTDMEITAAIIAMAHKLQLRVVAEGVETLEQLTFLRENQCDFIQGYFFSKPLSLPQLQAWLARAEQEQSVEPA